MATPHRLAATRLQLLLLLLLLFIALLLLPAHAEGLLDSASVDPCPSLSRGPGGGPPARCSIRCFRPDPVCGVDGVTYWCGCPDAACAGVRVVKRGFCEVGNSGSGGPVAGQALLLLHVVWLIVLGFAVLFGFV